jgi:hypothetical protein
VAGASDAGQTSYTQFQLETKFNRAEMISALADLQDDSNAFISLLGAADDTAIAILHADTNERLPPAAARFRGRYAGLLQTFQSSVKPYKDDSSDPFINVPIAVMRLVNAPSWETVDDEDRFSEPLFQIANITELLTMTLPPRAAASLEAINTAFPTPFFGDFSSSWGTPLSDKTVEIALNIRTQYCIDLMHKSINNPVFQPDFTLHNVFFDEAGGGLLALELTEDDGTSMRQSIRPLFERRIEDIRLHFTAQAPFVNLETLEAAFPWLEFRADLVQWAMHRATGLNDQITARGGAKRMQMQLQGGPPVVHISEKKRKSIGDKARQVNEMMARVKANKARRETLEAQKGDLANVPITIAEVQESPIQTGAYEPATNDMGMDDGDDNGNILASQQSLKVLEVLHLHATQSNKENLQAPRKGKFTDRQPDAQRIDLIDESPPTAGPSHKRGREASPDDDASSLHFEEDARPHINKRARSHAADDDLIAAAEQFTVNARQLGIAATQPLPSRQRSRGQAPPSTAPQMSTDDLPIVPTQTKGPQQRVPFTPDETARLIELIASLPEGTARISWAELEKQDARHPEGPLLQKRGQVGLKDKARNLKMDFLK